MHIPEHVFREYDIRGIYETDLTPEFARRLGAVFGTRLTKAGGHKIVVARDCRQSGIVLSAALIEGLTASGCQVTDIGMGPTPVQYWATVNWQADAGISVTGSHNPSEYNGFKLSMMGRSLSGEDITSLRAAMCDKDWHEAPGTKCEQDAIKPYIEALTANLQPAKRPLTVVVDGGNGVGGMTAVALYERLGYKIIPMYCEPDGNFPNHHADPSVLENLADLKKSVLEHQADIGIAFDGDADRIGVLDSDGEVIWGDHLMILLSRALLLECPGATIVGEVKCSRAMYDDIERHGGKGVMWRTGHSIIKAKMKELNAELAGEMSGHIFYKHRYHGFDDAVYAGGRLLEILSHSEEQQSLKERLADVPKLYSTPELRHECSDTIKFSLMQRLLEHFRKDAGQHGFHILDIDGARLEWSDGWGLVRCSNTTPVIITRYEATTEKRLAEIQDYISNALELEHRSLR